MNKLQEKKDKYTRGDISKNEYIDSMYELHSNLFDYQEFISDTDISKIEISCEGVIMTSREQGIKMLCSEQDKRIAPIEILNFGNYEQEELAMVHNLLDDGNIVFDVGANFGWYSLSIAKRFSKSSVYSFEPIKKTFRYLMKNIDLNGLSNIVANNFGFSNENKEITFYYYPEGSGNASAANLSEANTVESVTCMVKTMDQFVREKNVAVDFIKCDVEGSELMVFQGGLETIKKYQPIIFTEILRKWSKKFNYHPNDIIDILKNIGYRCFTCNEGKLVELTEVTDETVETNYYFLHQDRHADKLNKYLKK